MTGAGPEPVDRSPCWRCGIRADVGCAHRPEPRPSSLPAPSPKEITVPEYKDGKYISVPAEGALLKRIEVYAPAAQLSVPHACRSLIVEALDALDSLEAARAVDGVEEQTSAPGLLDVDPDQLVAELLTRLPGMDAAIAVDLLGRLPGFSLSAPIVAPATSTDVDMAAIRIECLAEEIARRVRDTVVGARVLHDANVRADTAEGTLAALRASLAELAR